MTFSSFLNLSRRTAALGSLLALSAIATATPSLAADPSSKRIEVAALATPTTARPVAVPDTTHLSGGGPVDLFGSVSLKVNKVVQHERWAALMQERADEMLTGECPVSDSFCQSKNFQHLVQLVKSVYGLPVETKIARINSAVDKQIVYTTDQELRGRIDHWATFRETVAAGRGDCEDIALTKYWLLRAAGVQADAMHLVLATETRRNLDHAVLVVRAGGKNLVLDNLRAGVSTDTQLGTTYKPLLSLSSVGTWVHGFKAPKVVVAART